MVDLLNHLNKEQRRAVKIKNGPILILAGAGSGKTRVITYRIAYLIKKGYAKPWDILAITFTNKAADEMRSRVYGLVEDASDIWIRTFHSTCARILRETADRLGIPPNFTIYDEHDQLKLIKECMQEYHIDPKTITPVYMAAIINRIKQNLKKPDNPYIKEFYKYYNNKLAEYNALDFGDLILKVVKLFQKDKEILEYYQNRFRYILVDEYQDTNRAQYMLTKLLAEKYRNICVVGDDDQSIYSWRGAEIRNILEFEYDFPEAVVIKLEQNYRSTKKILQLASMVVANNANRKPKVLWCENEEGEPIEYFKALDASNEAAFVTRKILELGYQGYSLGEIAIFYRINYQSRLFEDYLIRHQIPYQVIGSLKFYERAEVKNVLAYLNVINNPDDGVSLRRIINIPLRGIGQETIEKLQKYCKQKRITFFEALKRAEGIPGISQRIGRAIRDFVQMLEEFIERKEDMNPYELVMEVLDRTGYLSELKGAETDKEIARAKNVEELATSIRDYTKEHPDATLADYLSEVSLRSEIDDWNGRVDHVNLMTLHNAKGLEFDVVFITGLEEGLLPHYKSMDDPAQFEEERRLFYVGITRARKRLFLSYARRRDLYRGTNAREMSQFLSELMPQLTAEI